jgi:hypothetical protein
MALPEQLPRREQSQFVLLKTPAVLPDAGVKGDIPNFQEKGTGLTHAQ